MQKVVKGKVKELEKYELLSEEESINLRFGIKFGHALLGQDNYTELDDKLSESVSAVCMKHFRDALVEMAESFNVTVPMTLPFIVDEDEMGNTLVEILNGYKMARDGAPADCKLFTDKVAK